MTIKDYVAILKLVIETQINYVQEDSDTEDDEFHEGVIRGLELALDKIDASKFLYEGK